MAQSMKHRPNLRNFPVSGPLICDLFENVWKFEFHVFSHSDDATPVTEKDRLHVRDNLQLALSDAEKNKGHAILRAAGKGLKTAKQVFARICLSNFYSKSSR